MCGGSKSSNTQPPPPNPPTTFDYMSANRAQMDANAKVQRAQAANVVSSTQSFGSELGASAPAAPGAY